jgi:putative heme utilization carrier protein HutX
MTAIQPPDYLPAEAVLPLLRELPALGDTTTVILHGGCVFEFKGPFPGGSVAEGFYNLQGKQSSAPAQPRFEGHLRLEAMSRVRFQDRPHRGRASYAFVFEDDKSRCLFKVFLGRDDSGEVIPEQLAFFERLRREGQISAIDADTETSTADPEQ